jgi:hypothetical protein
MSGRSGNSIIRTGGSVTRIVRLFRRTEKETGETFLVKNLRADRSDRSFLLTENSEILGVATKELV